MPTAIDAINAALLACVCQQLANEGRPACACCQVVSSELPPMTGCDAASDGGAQGRAWSRLQPPVTFTASAPSKCPNGMWRVTFQVGVYRCIADHDGNCTDMTADAAKAHADAASLVTAVQCCDILQARAWVPGDVTIVGPAGGCVGVALSVQIDLPRLDTL